MVKAWFHAAAYAKSEGISELFLFFVADDRLEGMFGMQRVLECGRNFDMRGFEERGGELMRLSNYKGELPSHFRASRRLGGAFLDHINPRSFLHPGGSAEAQVSLVDPRICDIANAYNLGGADAAAFLTQSTGEKDGDDNEMDPPLFTPRQVDFSAIATSGVDMLRPNGDGLYVGLKNAREEDPEDDRGVCKNDLD
jgi:hypothetical protein